MYHSYNTCVFCIYILYYCIYIYIILLYICIYIYIIYLYIILYMYIYMQETYVGQKKTYRDESCSTPYLQTHLSSPPRHRLPRELLLQVTFGQQHQPHAGHTVALEMGVAMCQQNWMLAVYAI